MGIREKASHFFSFMWGFSTILPLSNMTVFLAGTLLTGEFKSKSAVAGLFTALALVGSAVAVGNISNVLTEAPAKISTSQALHALPADKVSLQPR
jgi:hypothetical protein